MTGRFLFLLVLFVVLFGGGVGAAFAGGMTLGEERGRSETRKEMTAQFQSQLSQLMARLGEKPGAEETPEALPRRPGRPGRGAIGTVERVEEGVVSISTPLGTVRVLLGEGTTIQRTVQGSLDDLAVGQRVSVLGERQPDGSIKAKALIIQALTTP